jgi:hypothetical protein
MVASNQVFLVKFVCNVHVSCITPLDVTTLISIETCKAHHESFLSFLLATAYHVCMYLFTANGPKSGGRITSTLIIYKSK